MDRTISEVFETFTEEEKEMTYFVVGKIVEGNSNPLNTKEYTTTKRLYDSLNSEQKKVLRFILAEAEKEAFSNDNN